MKRFFSLHKSQFLLYVAFSSFPAVFIGMEHGMLKGISFAIGCNVFLVIVAYITYRKHFSQYGKK